MTAPEVCEVCAAPGRRIRWPNESRTQLHLCQACDALMSEYRVERLRYRAQVAWDAGANEDAGALDLCATWLDAARTQEGQDL